MKICYSLLLSILLVLAACSGGQKKDKGKAKDQQQKSKDDLNSIVFDAEQIKNGGIDTGQLPFHRLSTSITVNGQVDVPPENLMSVNVPMGGFLKRTTMLPGQHVTKGQVIAEIQNPDYISLQQDYLTAVSKITFLKQELERQRILSHEEASPLKVYQQSQSDYNSERAQAAGLAKKLSLLGINSQSLNSDNIRSVIFIHSPLSGYVSKVYVNMGRYVNTTDALMELVDISDIHAALNVFEQDVSKIAIGNKVEITLPSLPGRSYPGRVILIGRMLDTSRSVMVHCHFLKTDKNLLPNMFLQAAIRTKPLNTQAVPDEALINYSSKRYVFVATRQRKGLQFSMVPVTVGVQEGGWNEIKLVNEELKNRTFVLKGAFSILSALKNTGEGD